MARNELRYVLGRSQAIAAKTVVLGSVRSVMSDDTERSVVSKLVFTVNIMRRLMT